MSETTVITVAELREYMGYDEVDTMTSNNMTRTIRTTDAFLKGSIGANYPTDDARIKELALIIASDLYENRGYTNSSSMSNNVRRLVDDMCLQLRLELSESYEEEDTITAEIEDDILIVRR